MAAAGDAWLTKLRIRILMNLGASEKGEPARALLTVVIPVAAF
jgi:hypothetical protein